MASSSRAVRERRVAGKCGRVVSNSCDHPEKISELAAALASDNKRSRLGAASALRRLSESSPAQVYPHLEIFRKNLRNENSILRWTSLLTLGNLAGVDVDRRLDAMLDDILDPLRGPSMIDAANAMKSATAIAKAKPHLGPKIMTALTRVEASRYQTPECRDVVIGFALDAMRELLTTTCHDAAAEQFALRQLKNQRSTTRKKAERLLKTCRLQPSLSPSSAMSHTSSGSGNSRTL